MDWAKAACAQKAFIVDGNPVMRDAVHFVIAVLLVVDKLGNKEGWDWPQRMTLAELFLTNASSRELISQELGVQFDEKLADDVCGRFRAFAISWSSETDAIGRFQHLTRMALNGDIVVATRDLSSPRAIAVINRQLADWQLTVSHLHLTNVLDYVPNVAEVSRLLSSLSSTPHTTISTSSLYSEAWFLLGSFESPAFFSDAAFFLQDNVEAREEVFWASENWSRRHWQNAIISLAGNHRMGSINARTSLNQFVHQAVSASCPRTCDEFKTRLAELNSVLFSDEKTALARLDVYLWEILAGYQADRDLISRALRRLNLPSTEAPANFEDMVAKAQPLLKRALAYCALQISK